MDDKLERFLDMSLAIIGMDFGRAESQMLISLMTARPDGTFIYTPVDPDRFYNTVERGDRISVTSNDISFVIIDECADFTDREIALFGRGMAKEKMSRVAMYRLIDKYRNFPAPMEQTIPDGPPMKQNGRSAAYLAHDPSKHHKRIRS